MNPTHKALHLRSCNVMGLQLYRTSCCWTGRNEQCMNVQSLLSSTGRQSPSFDSRSRYHDQIRSRMLSRHLFQDREVQLCTQPRIQKSEYQQSLNRISQVLSAVVIFVFLPVTWSVDVADCDFLFGSLTTAVWVVQLLVLYTSTSVTDEV